MRLGWEDPEECLKLAPIINELPLRQVVMHPRLGKQQYKEKLTLKRLRLFRMPASIRSSIMEISIV